MARWWLSALFGLLIHPFWRQVFPVYATNVRLVAKFPSGELMTLETGVIKRFSLLTAAIVVSIVGLTQSGAAAMLDGAISVASSNTDVLQVTQLEGGLFRVDFVGPGEAKLLVSADADLSDDVRTLYQEYAFLIYDQAAEADQFDLQIVEVVPRAAEDAGGVDVAGEVDSAAAETGAEGAAVAGDTV